MDKPKVNNNIFSATGRVHRLNYFFVRLISLLLEKIALVFLFPVDSVLYNYDSGINLCAGIVLGFSLYLYVYATIKRLRDLKTSSGFAILALIPIICLVVVIPCLFCKSKWKEEVQDK